MKKLIGLVVSAAIIAIIWTRIDLSAIGDAARAADPWWLATGLALVVPITLATAWRFRILARADVGTGEAVRLILAASTLNLVLPSKMGDIAKAWVLVRRHRLNGERALSLVVLEKMLDMAALLAWGVPALLWVGGGDPIYLLAALATGGLFALLALLLSPLARGTALIDRLAAMLPQAVATRVRGFAGQWRAILDWFWARPVRAMGVLALSLGLWGVHLLQFWFFAMALGTVGLFDNMAWATLAILAGLVPLTMAGIGTRDAAIVLFYGPALGAGGAAVLGVLATSRYLMPALAGLPFIGDFWRQRGAMRAGAGATK